jgi:hypothetical protein
MSLEEGAAVSGCSSSSVLPVKVMIETQLLYIIRHQRTEAGSGLVLAEILFIRVAEVGADRELAAVSGSLHAGLNRSLASVGISHPGKYEFYIFGNTDGSERQQKYTCNKITFHSIFLLIGFTSTKLPKTWHLVLPCPQARLQSLTR